MSFLISEIYAFPDIPSIVNSIFEDKSILVKLKKVFHM